jgi:hypothetical protein
MDNNNTIYRNLPEGYNQYQDIITRRQDIYNPHPVTSQRVDDTYNTIKKELSTFEIMDVTKKIVSIIDYFKYEQKLYKISELPMETLYKDTQKKLITDEKLFSSTQKTFLDEHLSKREEQERQLREEEKIINKDKDTETAYSNLPTLTPSPGREPITASYFVSRSLSSYGTNRVDIKNMLLDHKKILQILLYYFILKFNVEARKSNYNMPMHQWTNFFISDYQLIRIQYNKTLNLYYYVFEVEIFRTNKNAGYALYLEMYYRAEKTQIWISKAFVIGVIPQGELSFKKLDYFNTNMNPKMSYFALDEKNSILDQDDTYNKMKDYEFRNKNTKSVTYDIFTRDFDLHGDRKCFKPFDESYPDSKNSNACLSIDPKLNKTGVWDKMCIKNEDCPYFQANKNYPNNFGGCVEGVCQLPVGMNKIGFKHYDKEKPLCYNCTLKTEIMNTDGTISIQNRECSGIECNKCCDIQHNKKIYPDMKSPDFVFSNDQTERERYSKLLELNGLGVNKLIM